MIGEKQASKGQGDEVGKINTMTGQVNSESEKGLKFPTENKACSSVEGAETGPNENPWLSNPDSIDPSSSSKEKSEASNTASKRSTDEDNQETPRGANQKEDSEEEEGGPLWKAASEEANNYRQLRGFVERRCLPESMLFQARSRAESNQVPGIGGNIRQVNSAVESIYHVNSAVGSIRHVNSAGGRISHMDSLDHTYILNSTLAKKRVKVVQLLMFGLLGSLFGFFGSFYVQSTCHYVSANVEFVNNGNNFTLHYGLWKWSPIESAYQDYAYCVQYDDIEYSDNYDVGDPDPPRWQQIFGICSIIMGSYALGVLWLYLICGKGTYQYWVLAVTLAFSAGICQIFILTLEFFQNSICQEYGCLFGPGAYASIISSIGWFVLSYELYYNMPMKSGNMVYAKSGGDGSSMLSVIGMADFSEGASAYLDRFDNKSEQKTRHIPILNEIQRRNPTGHIIKISSSRSRSYQAPDLEA